MSVNLVVNDGSDPELDADRPPTIDLERELEHLILHGELKPGERLNELQLSNRFGISRGPLREAMRGLQAKGLITQVRNRGMYVRAVSTEEALEIYDVRAAIFGLVGRLLAERVTERMLEELGAQLEAMDRFAAEKDIDGYYPANLAFHDYLVTSTGNSVLVREYKSLVDKLHLCRARGLVRTGGMTLSNREHREMVDSIGSGDPFRAQEALFRHVERAKKRFWSAANEVLSKQGPSAEEESVKG